MPNLPKTEHELAKYFDHTYLKPDATDKEMKKLCDEARALDTAMVAINTAWTIPCKEWLKGTDVHVGAAISFPLGQSGLESKLFECEQAIKDGCDEIDYVIHIGKAKMHDWDYIKEEMEKMTAICHRYDIPCKVIFENCYLTKDEIRKLSGIAKEVKPDYIKTSTGFGTGGATVEDVALMKSVVGDDVKVKAAGGIRDWPTCKAMIEAGASRIGTSSSIKILEQFRKEQEKPYILEPIPDYTIWGNDILSKFRHADKNYGTWWEVSAHPYCTNQIKGSDMTLQELIDSDPDQMLGQGLGHHEMLRVAFLDAKDALSIQVHPYDTYAAEHENDFGKDESWYVIDAVPGAKLVAGTKTSDPDTLKEAVKNGTLEQHLIYHDVKAGDYIDIPAGTLHALGAGIFAIEVGTNSNTTYRFYDYNRKDANGNTRPLHLEKSFDVADFSRKPHVVEAKEETRVLSDMPSYTVTEVYAKEDVTYPQNSTYCLISNIGDDTSIETGEKEYELKKFESCFIPASASCVTIKKGAHVLYSKVKG